MPSISELETHYRELEAERERLREMIEKTDRMKGAVKRGMEHLREVNRSAGPGTNVGTSLGAGDGGMSTSAGITASSTSAGTGTGSIPLPTTRGERREGMSTSVWPVESDISRRD